MSRVQPPRIIQQLKSLRADVDQLKQPQRIGGDSLLGYFTYSNSLNDYSFVLPGYGRRMVIVTFTPTNSQINAIVEMFLFTSINNSAVPNPSAPDVMNNASVPWAQDGTYMVTDIQKLPPSGGSTKWRVMFADYTLGTSTTVYMKCIFNGTDSGTFTFA